MKSNSTKLLEYEFQVSPTISCLRGGRGLGKGRMKIKGDWSLTSMSGGG